MKKYRAIFIIIFIFALFGVSKLLASELDGVAVYDAIRLLNKPDLSQYGVRKLGWVYTPTLWKGVTDREQLPNKTNVLKEVAAMRKKAKVIFLDIEHWPTIGDEETVNKTIGSLSTIIGWIKKEYPDILIGYYGILPIRNYWSAVKGENSVEYKDWQEENDKLKPLASVVDVIFPSIYTFYDDTEGWVKYAQAQIKEAKRYGKPVIAFLWPYYHGSNDLKHGQPLPDEYWRLELETLKNADVNIAIWASGTVTTNKPNVWDDNAGWWVVTKEFLQKIKNSELNKPSNLRIVE